MKEKQTRRFQKNERFHAVVTGMTGEGNGVCKIDGYTVFVPDTAVGDECEIRLVKCNKSFAFGRLEKVLIPSSDRIEPACPVFRQCGGCVFQHVSYEAELAHKEELVRDAFLRLGGLELPVRPILKSGRTEGYRNKAQYPVGMDGEGQAVAGFYARRSHRLVASGDCCLQPELFAQVQGSILAFLREKGIPIYREADGSGLVRHIYLRYGEATGELMACIVAAGRKLPHTPELIRRLTGEFPQLKSLILNVNQADTNVILGNECITLWGTDTITDILCGVRVKLSPLSFYQVNHSQAERLYETALRYAGLTGEEILLDLYCGAGTIGLAAASQVKSLIGVEIIPEAVENARENAAANGVQNASFFCADAGEAAKRLAKEGIRPDVIIVDPPRKGLDETVIDAVVEMSPSRLVMVSCNPATAARDTALLAKRGYIPAEVTPVDMFPRTGHVETVVQLSRKTPDDIIHVDLDLTGLPLTKAEAAATYTQIKEYVLEQTGMKVSSLYVSQVKRKCGLEVGDSYNKPKNEEAKQPQCPPDKEAAIMAALRHYKMIG